MNFFKKTEKSKKNITLQDVLAKCAWLWSKTYKAVFILFFSVLVGLGAYIWYQSIYSGQWSADKKQQYLNSQEKSVSLKVREFNKALDDIAQRKKTFDGAYTPVKDIFAPYPGAPEDNH